MKNNENYLTALEVAGDVEEAVKAAGPSGLLFVEGAAICGMEYNQFYSAIKELVVLGRLKLTGARRGNQNQIVMPDWNGSMAPTLTENQQKLLDFLVKSADQNGKVIASRTAITKHLKLKSPTFLLDRLDYKGFLEFIDFGGPTQAACFKIYPDGDGPRGYTWRNLNHNRRIRGD